MSESDEVVMYIVARTDVQMSPGKLAAQVGHGVHLALNLARTIHGMGSGFLIPWENNSYPKIILGGDSKDFARLCERVPGGLLAKVVDEGRTEIQRGTMTCLALVPLPKTGAKQWVGRLRLFK